ncbi:hypothetical protein [Streptosporangium sp. V21-05]|uniref:hypothetical protein n=1 Tax=Streptosporangium sp. V21-05 TaxID=3446115 RepID=UPI003F53D643
MTGRDSPAESQRERPELVGKRRADHFLKGHNLGFRQRNSRREFSEPGEFSGHLVQADV